MWNSEGHVVVTGSLGRVGRAVCKELDAHGIRWRGVDRSAHPVFTDTGAFAHVRHDLRDYGAAVEALAGAASVIHTAAIAYPSFEPDHKTFADNVTSSFNVFSAAALHGISRVVWLSSEEVYGHPYGPTLPSYVPIDEAHPLKAGNTYALAKTVTEQTAAYFSGAFDMVTIGLRSTVVQDANDYETYPALLENPATRIWSLWRYIDSRDLARACRLALAADISGAHLFNVAARDTVVDVPTRELADRYLEGVPRHWPDDADPHVSFCDTRAARTAIGFEPEYSWRASARASDADGAAGDGHAVS